MSGFICLYYGNTGSSWLVETLSTSPRVFVPGFEPLERWAWKGSDREKADWARTALTPPAATSSRAAIAEWHEALQESPQVKPDHFKLGFDMTGWKMAWAAIDDPLSVLGVMAETGAKAIVLSRENRVKHALSLYRYHEEGKSQFQGTGERPPSRVEKDALQRWLKESQRLHDEGSSFGNRCRETLGSDNVLSITYEEFVTAEGKTSTIERMCHFLGIDPAGIRLSRFEKATPDALSSALENFEELRKSYRFSRYRRFFSD